jgi:DNA-binding IclR family transcriptional regulator
MGESMILKTETAPVVVRFTIGDYTDALHFANQAERDQYSDVQIINAPRPEPTPEEIQAQIDALTAQQRATQDQILALASNDVALPILQAQAEIIAGQIAALTGQG